MTEPEPLAMPNCPRCGGAPIAEPGAMNPFLVRPRRITCADCGAEIALALEDDDSPPSARTIWDLDR